MNQPLFNNRVFLSTVPVVVFFALTRVAPSWVAISGGFAASAVVFYYSRQDRLIGALAAFGFAIVGTSAVIGLIWDNERAYLAADPVRDFLFVPLYLITMLFRKPVIGGIAREMFPRVAATVPIHAPVFAWLSVAWAGYDIVQGLLRIYLLQELSVGQYLIWSRVLSWPLTMVVVSASTFFIMREVRKRTAAAGPDVEPAPNSASATLAPGS
jgi:intracellular septation protein A